MRRWPRSASHAQGLEAWNAERRKNAHVYNELLSHAGITLPVEAGYAKHVNRVYAVRLKNLDQVIRALSEKGISCGIHYPVPIHLRNAYSSLNLGVGSFPAAESRASEFLSLPMFPELRREQIEYVATELKALS